MRAGPIRLTSIAIVADVMKSLAPSKSCAWLARLGREVTALHVAGLDVGSIYLVCLALRLDTAAAF